MGRPFRWIAATLVGAGLVACGGSDTSKAPVTVPTTLIRPARSTTIPPPPVTFDEMTGAITVYAAASLVGTFDEIAAAFAEANPGASAVVTFDTSSAIVGGVARGAGIDVFATADPVQMDKAVSDGLIAGEPVTFANDVMEIVVPSGNPKKIADMAGLSKRTIKVALCDADRPCGRSARKVLKAANVKVATTDAPADAAGVVAQVLAGQADAGFVYHSEVVASGAADLVRIAIPLDANSYAEHSVAVVANSHRKALDAAFVAFLTGPTGQAILDKDGFVTS